MRIYAGQQPVPLLDGVRVNDVVALDVSEGWIERSVRDDAGNYRCSDGYFVTERVYGEVGVVFEYPSSW